METNSDTRPDQEVGTSSPQVRRLTRRVDQKMIGGVAAGLGDYFGVDPVWFRLGFVLATLAGGAGLIAYVLLWLIAPAAFGPAPGGLPARPLGRRVAGRLDRTPAWVGVVILSLGVLLVLNQLVEWRPGVFWGIALVVVGVMLFRRGDQQMAAAPPTLPPPPPPPTHYPDSPLKGAEAPSEERATEASHWTATAQTSPLWTQGVVPAGPAAADVRVRRERSALGWVTFGAALLAIGIAALLDAIGVFHVAFGQYLALVLAVVGIGLLAGAWWGRARWLIVPGVLLVPFVMVGSLIEVPFAGGFGDWRYRPATAQVIQPEYRMVAGQMVIDLRDTDLGSDPTFIRATGVAGRILVLVPSDAQVQVRARAGAGEVALFGQTYDGVRVDVQRTFGTSTSRESPGIIHLDLETSLGQVEVNS